MQQNRLTVNDLNAVKHNLRRTYLVRAPHGLFWIVLSRVARGRVRAGVFVVERRPPPGGRADGESQQSRAPPGLTYRVTTVTDATGIAKSRSRPRRIGSSSSLTGDNRGDGGKGGGGCANDTYAIIRSREGTVEFHWWLDP